MYVHLKQPDLLDAFAKGIERLAEGAPAGLHREPRAATAEGRDRDPGARPSPLRLVALLVALALVFVVAAGPAPPGVRGGA